MEVLSVEGFEAASLDAAARVMRSPVGWLAVAASVAASVAALCGVEALEWPAIAVGLGVPAWLAWCWLSVAGREAR